MYMIFIEIFPVFLAVQNYKEDHPQKVYKDEELLQKRANSKPQSIIVLKWFSYICTQHIATDKLWSLPNIRGTKNAVIYSEV